MLKKFAGYLKQIIPLMRNSLLPALLLCAALVVYFALEPFEQGLLHGLHLGFFAINIFSIGLLVYFNQNRPLFYILIMMLAYMLINYFKYQHGIIYYLTPSYYNLAFFTVCGLLFYYFLPNRPLFSRDTIGFILIILAALTLGEQMNKSQIGIDFSLTQCIGCGLQSFSFALFVTAIAIMMFNASVKDEILTSALFFATISIMLGFYFSLRPSSLAIFFFNAALTVAVGTAHSIYYSRRKDTVTGLDNGNSFIAAAAKFPLKYGLGIICIDDYKHLVQIFKKAGINELLAMVSRKIREQEPESLLYRCSPDEFIIVFPQAEKGTSFNRLDEIRRSIAAAEFMLSSRKKPLKITVSCSIAEKKRSDADVFEVFIRARRILQKTYKFTQNITSKA